MASRMYEANGVYIIPDDIFLGEKIKIKYKGILATSGAAEVFLHYGYGTYWYKKKTVPMTKNGEYFEVEINIDYFNNLYLCFKDKAYPYPNWDNNSGINYIFEVRRKISDVISLEQKKTDTIDKIFKYYSYVVSLLSAIALFYNIFSNAFNKNPSMPIFISVVLFLNLMIGLTYFLKLKKERKYERIKISKILNENKENFIREIQNYQDEIKNLDIKNEDKTKIISKNFHDFTHCMRDSLYMIINKYFENQQSHEVSNEAYEKVVDYLQEVFEVLTSKGDPCINLKIIQTKENVDRLNWNTITICRSKNTEEHRKNDILQPHPIRQYTELREIMLGEKSVYAILNIDEYNDAMRQAGKGLTLYENPNGWYGMYNSKISVGIRLKKEYLPPNVENKNDDVEKLFHYVGFITVDFKNNIEPAVLDMYSCILFSFADLLYKYIEQDILYTYRAKINSKKESENT